jgi:hypothetical protein
MLAKAFDAFVGLEKFLISEAELPSIYADIPSTVAELDKMRRQASEHRRARRARANGNALRPR